MYFLVLFCVQLMEELFLDYGMKQEYLKVQLKLTLMPTYPQRPPPPRHLRDKTKQSLEIACLFSMFFIMFLCYAKRLYLYRTGSHMQEPARLCSLSLSLHLFVSLSFCLSVIFSVSFPLFSCLSVSLSLSLSGVVIWLHGVVFMCAHQRTKHVSGYHSLLGSILYWEIASITECEARHFV